MTAAQEHVLLVAGHDAAYQHYLGLPFRFTVVQRHGSVGVNIRSLTEHIVEVPSLERETIHAVAKAIHASAPLDFVFTFDEELSPHVASLAELFGVAGPTLDAVVACVDKVRMRQVLAGSEFEVEFMLCPSLDDARTFLTKHPNGIVLKVVNGSGSRDVYHVVDEIQLEAAYRVFVQCGEVPLAEEFIHGRQISAETITLREYHELIAITGTTLRPGTLIPEQHVIPAPGVNKLQAEAIAGFCSRLLTRIGHKHGPCHIELKLTAAGPRLVEINNRVGGNFIGMLTRLVTGVNLHRETVQYFAAGVPSAAERASRIQYRVGACRSFFGAIRASEVARILAPTDVLRLHLTEDLPEVGLIRSTDDRLGPAVFASNDTMTFEAVLTALDRVAP